MRRFSLGSKQEGDDDIHSVNKDVPCSGHSRNSATEEESSYSSSISIGESRRVVATTPGRKTSIADLDEISPQKPQSRRRRSLLGCSSRSEQDDDDYAAPERPPSHRRRSLFGSTPPDSSPATPDSVEPKKPSSQRRRSVFGSTPSNDSMEPVKVKASSSFQKSVFGSLQPSEHSRGSDATPKSQIRKTIEQTPPKPNNKKTPRRGSLSAFLSGSSKDGSERSKPARRSTITSGNGSSMQEESDKKPGSRRHSLCDGSTQSVASDQSAPTVHTMVNQARQKRDLKEFSRNMLMDTIASQVAQDLAASGGRKCSPTNYHGNVGQGATVKSILKTMMVQKGTAKANIISAQFTEFGVGMKKGQDGLIYMCQLFK